MTTKQEKIDGIKALCKDETLTKKQINAVWDAAMAYIIEQLKSDNDVVLDGVGRFHRAESAARTARNPSTGEALEIPARKVPKFTFSPSAKKELIEVIVA